MREDSEFTFAYVAATGEQVYIAKSHLEVFGDVYTTKAPKGETAQPSADRKKEN